MCVKNIYNEFFFYSHLDYPDIDGRNGVIKDNETQQVLKQFNGE